MNKSRSIDDLLKSAREGKVELQTPEPPDLPPGFATRVSQESSSPTLNLLLQIRRATLLSLGCASVAAIVIHQGFRSPETIPPAAGAASAPWMEMPSLETTQ